MLFRDEYSGTLHGRLDIDALLLREREVTWTSSRRLVLVNDA